MFYKQRQGLIVVVYSELVNNKLSQHDISCEVQRKILSMNESMHVNDDKYEKKVRAPFMTTITRCVKHSFYVNCDLCYHKCVND